MHVQQHSSAVKIDDKSGAQHGKKAIFVTKKKETKILNDLIISLIRQIDELLF